MPLGSLATLSCSTSHNKMYPDLAHNGSRWGVVWNDLSPVTVYSSVWIP